jgi:hypothetical protein
MLARGRGGARARVAVALGVWLLAGLAPRPALADPATDKARAADAYERGRIANERGDFARAARELALADSILPDPVTLRVALHAATLADDPVQGTILLERAARGTVDRALADIVAEARVRFAHRTGRIVVTCPATVHCMATIDAEAATPAEPRIVTLGVHTVGVQGDGAPEQRMIEVTADETVTVGLSAPGPPPRSLPAQPAQPDPTAHRGASPVWFAAAATLTAVTGGFAIGSAVDTANRHAQFDQAGCERASSAACAGLRSDGLSAQGRTALLLVGTGVTAAATATLGIFFVRWIGGRDASVGVRASGVFARTSF